MISFNISFPFRGHTHIASVYISSSGSYIVYFTDVELVLEFGNKIELLRNGGIRTSKKSSVSAMTLLQQALGPVINKAA